MIKGKEESQVSVIKAADYKGLLRHVIIFLNEARYASARSINAIITVTYWEIGRRIVEFEQGGANRALYGEALLKRLSQDLSKKFGRGFSEENLRLMRLFYQHYEDRISQTPSGKLSSTLLLEKSQTVSGKFPLSWSHYVRLISLDDPAKRDFYEQEAQRDGWSVAVAHYALGGMNNKVFASRYKLQLPDPKILAREIEAKRRQLERRHNSKFR